MSYRIRTLLFLLAAIPAALEAQTGRIAGTITDASQSPLASATITIAATRQGAVSDAQGRYVIVNVAPGTYDVRVQRIGDRMEVFSNIVVTAGQETRLDATLTPAPLTLAGVVVSASRRTEKVTEAPATITVITSDQIDQSVGNSFVAALKEAKGVDFIQTGMTSIAINARGFNSSFNNRFLMVEDGRISVLPENGLPVGQFTPTPKVDIAGMEVLVGPGSALYGPDASSGVLSLTTKDPRQFPGTTFEVTGGNRSYADIQGRHAGVSGNIGYKIAGEYQTAKDWENILTYNANGTVVAPNTSGAVTEADLRGNPIDWKTGVARGSGALVYYAGQNRFELNGGMSRTDGVGQTNVGRNQLSGWLYNVIQARATTPHWFVNAYRAQSKSGESFALNRYAGAQLAAANASVTPDSLRMLSDWPSDGRMYAAEVQGNYTLPVLGSSSSVLSSVSTVFGAQYRNDIASSHRQWLTDRITDEDVSNQQIGYYAQITAPVVPQLEVVLAGRLDDPESFDKQWSPKAGVIIKPIEDQVFRVTFNRAYKSPTILQTNFFIPDWTAIISIYGNTGGFTTQNGAGTTVATFKPVEPESNRTWEYGYKGIFMDRLFVDATYFSSKYQNFLSPLTIVGNPFAGTPTYAVPISNPGGNIPVNSQGRIVNQAGGTPIVLTYYNLGRATVKGVDAGVNFLLTPRIELRSTLSTVELKTATVLGEATSLNSPGTKWTVGTTMKDIGPVSAGMTWRNVVGYYFRSGVNTGVIPTFGAVDANVSFRIPNLSSAMINVGVSNLFSCTSEKVTYSTPAVTPPAVSRPNSVIASRDEGCGFNRKHIEMINMPEVGTMAFVGVRWSR